MMPGPTAVRNSSLREASVGSLHVLLPLMLCFLPICVVMIVERYGVVAGSPASGRTGCMKRDVPSFGSRKSLSTTQPAVRSSLPCTCRTTSQRLGTSGNSVRRPSPRAAPWRSASGSSQRT